MYIVCVKFLYLYSQNVVSVINDIDLYFVVFIDKNNTVCYQSVHFKINERDNNIVI